MGIKLIDFLENIAECEGIPGYKLFGTYHNMFVSNIKEKYRKAIYEEGVLLVDNRKQYI